MIDFVDIKNICCIGAGYVGGPTMAVIAEKCPQIRVNVVDKDPNRIKAWNDLNLENLPIYEPGLKDIVGRVRNINLFFSTDIVDNIKKADAVFISVNTPIKKSGLGAGQASNLCWVESCARQIAEVAEGHTIVIEKSTLPVRTAQIIKEILQDSSFPRKTSQNKKTFSVLSNPEFLAEGSAIMDLLKPDRVLIGGEDINSINSLSAIYENWIEKEKILSTNLWSSELSKLAANAFLAQRISSINSIAAFCEVSGADINEVSHAIGLDRRIGAEFLKAGPGFGGSCFKKDILNLVYLSRYFGLQEVAEYWEQVVKINSWQQKRIYEIIVNKLFGNLVDKKIALLGFAFKENTNDTRESPSISIAKFLLNEGAKLSIHDPKVNINQINKDLSFENDLNPNNQISGKWNFKEYIFDAVKDCDAIIVLTEWKEYKNLNWEDVFKLVRKPSWVFDTRSILDGDIIKKSGFNYWSVGIG